MGIAASEMVAAGLPVKFVRIPALCEGTITPKDFPILVFVGGENVHTRFSKGAPLDEALRRYEQAGGVIVWASAEPWPMFHDLDSGQTSYSQRVGLHLAGGFRRTAVGRFTVSLPRGAVLVRIEAVSSERRPAVPSLRAGADFQGQFEPLAVLVDPAGHELGAAIARLDSNNEPRSRMIYVWYRMWDVVDPSALLKAVLDAATALRH